MSAPGPDDDGPVALTVPDSDPRRRQRSLAVPATTSRRSLPTPAVLRFCHGPMGCGKSTLALQVDHSQSGHGRSGLLLTLGDRSTGPQISSRIGLVRPAVEVGADTDLRLLVRQHWAEGRRIDYLIVDEAQFLTPAQVDQLTELVDESHVDVWTFGLTTDFRTRLFPGTQRLLEVADEVSRVPVAVLCWCGLPGLLNARVVDGAMVRHGATVVVADTSPTPAPAEPTPVAAGTPGTPSPPAGDVHYQVLCRRHHALGQLGPTAAGPGQMSLP